MEQTLRDESDRWLREKDRRRRHGEPKGMPYLGPPTTRSKDDTGSYEQLAQQETQQTLSRRYPGDMDLDDDDYRQPPPVRHRDPRDPRDPRDRDMEPPRPVATGRIPGQLRAIRRSPVTLPSMPSLHNSRDTLQVNPNTTVRRENPGLSVAATPRLLRRPSADRRSQEVMVNPDILPGRGHRSLNLYRLLMTKVKRYNEWCLFFRIS